MVRLEVIVLIAAAVIFLIIGVICQSVGAERALTGVFYTLAIVMTVATPMAIYMGSSTHFEEPKHRRS